MTATILPFPQPAMPEPFEAEYLAMIGQGQGPAPELGVVIDMATRRRLRGRAGQDNRPAGLERPQSA